MVKEVAKLQCPQGEIQGIQKERHQYFLRIPFAKAHKRYVRADPVEQWDGVLDATQAPEQAPQKVAPLVSGSTPESEDCLFLNIYTPKADGKKRAVMVWLYGGGFTQGSAYTKLYNGKYLAERGDIVVVTVNYRIGLLGYGYFEHLKDHSLDAVPNIGLHDQLEALRWVQKTISCFGGDPEQVTLFGQSAGAMSICAMLACPQAEGLFKRAICQSGGDVLISSPETVRKVTDKALRKIGVDHSNVDLLSSLSSDALKKGPDELLHLAYGTELLPENPIEVLRKKRGHQVDLLMGYTQHEMALPLVAKKLGYIGKAIDRFSSVQLNASYKTVADMPLLSSAVKNKMKELIQFYQNYYQNKNQKLHESEICAAILTDAIFAVPTQRFLGAHSRYNPNTYAFRFDWGVSVLGSKAISFHACDVPFPFGTLNVLKGNFSRIAGIKAEAHALSDKMLDAWIAFAKTGNPNQPDDQQWQAYSNQSPGFMHFDHHSEFKSNERKELFDFWEQLLGHDVSSTLV